MNNEYKEWHKQLLKEKAEMLEEIRTAKDEAIREVYKLKKLAHGDICKTLRILNRVSDDGSLSYNADWEVDNPHAPGYIENRPFYSETKEVTLLDNVTVVSEWGTGFAEALCAVNLTNGATVTGTFNGTAFEAIWEDGFSVPGEDVYFFKHWDEENVLVLSSNEYVDSRTDVITLNAPIERVQQIDEKFIPAHTVLTYGEEQLTHFCVDVPEDDRTYGKPGFRIVGETLMLTEGYTKDCIRLDSNIFPHGTYFSYPTAKGTPVSKTIDLSRITEREQLDSYNYSLIGKINTATGVVYFCLFRHNGTYSGSVYLSGVGFIHYEATYDSGTATFTYTGRLIYSEGE